jgi:DNA-binding transcriptional LysR family regulator
VSGQLHAGTVDVAVTVDYPLGPRRGDPRYERIELARDPLRAVLPHGHALAYQRSVSISSLAGDAWIVGTPGHPCFDITVAAYAAAAITPSIVHRINDWDAVIALVAAGAGIALVPTLALEDDHRGIVAHPIRPHEPARTIYAAVRAGSAQAPHIAAALVALQSAAAATGLRRSS